MHRATALLACLALLSPLTGCSALAGPDAGPRTTLPGDGDPDWPPARATTAGTATATVPGASAPTAAPTGPPPGLTGERVGSPSALADAHAARLGNRSYAIRWTATVRVRATGAETARTDHRGRFAGEAGRYHAWVDRTGESTREVYADGRAAYTRVGGGPEADGRIAARPAVLSSRGVVGFGPTKRDFVADAFAAFGNREVVQYQTRDGVRYLVRSATLTAPERLPGADSSAASNATLQAVVYPSGVVHGLLVSYDVVRNGTVHTRVYQLDVTAVGSTTVDRPGWVTEPAE